MVREPVDRRDSRCVGSSSGRELWKNTVREVEGREDRPRTILQRKRKLDILVNGGLLMALGLFPSLNAVVYQVIFLQ